MTTSSISISATTAIVSMFLGAPALSSAVFEVTVPVLGDIKFVTALFFDLGIYLIVVGLVLDVLRSLGARLDVETTIARTAARIENSRSDTTTDDAAGATTGQVSR